MRRIPLWLKVVFTAWVAVWAPCYWRYWGPQNFLWFCDIGNFAIAVALWTESRLLFSWQAVSLLLVQTVYGIDLAGRVLLGFHPIGGSEYMFNVAIPLHVRLLSLFHVVTPFLLAWGVWRLGYDRRAWLVQTATAWVVLPLSWWLTDPSRDINWVYGPFDRVQTRIPPETYLLVCLIAYPALLYLPSHALLALTFGRERR